MSSSSSKKRRVSSPVNLLNLPDDLLWNCLARVSIFDYPILSLVSKRFRSLLASMELYKTRTLLARTESCLCFLIDSDPRLFILGHRTTRIPNPNPNKSCDNNVMVALRTRVHFPTDWWNLVAVGSNIYMIGGYNRYAPSSRVFFLDPLHTWHEASSMHVARKFPNVAVLDGKIYVAGGIEDYDSSNWVECFDPKTQKWEHVPIPNADRPERYIFKSFAVEGNLYLMGEEKTVVYKPKGDKWDAMIGLKMCTGFYSSICVVDNILYGCGPSEWSTTLEWYDFETRSWRVVKGLENLPGLPSCVKLVNYGGKIAVFYVRKKKIWFAVIAVEKRNGQEIYGKINRYEVVHTVPKSFSIEKCIVVNV